MENTPKRPATSDSPRVPAALGGEVPGGHLPALSDLSEDVVELKTKIAALVQGRYGGDYRQAFDYYDADHAGITAEQLKQLLADADIGNAFTRGSWVSGIMDKLDVNQDG